MDEEELNKFIEEIANKYASGNLTTEENQAINNVPVPVPNDQGNYLRPTIIPNRFGLEGRLNDLSGYANVGTSGRFGLTPQDISAGISGNQGNLDLRIPLDDPRRLNVSAATEVANNILSANWTPMEKALFSLNIPLNQ